MRARVCAVLLLWICWAGAAGARPGGGSHYSSGHSSPSHSSSSSSGASYHSYGSGSGSALGELSPGALALLVGALVLAGVIYVLIKAAAGQRVARAEVTVDDAGRQAGLSALLAQDPAFDRAAFEARAQAVMARVNEAWVKGDMGAARALISDGVYVRFQTQLALLKAAGLRNSMAGWRAVAAEVAAAEADALWDTVHVKIVGEARDADLAITLPPDQAALKVGRAPLERYEEVWSFLRRRGKHSRAGVPALEGKCANCGAPLPLSDVIRCDHCKALTNSGEHDWVLAEITQPEEFRSAAASEELPGLDELRARDPGVSRQELEDRASVVFWKWIEAVTTGERKKLDRFCLHAGQPPIARAQLAEVAVGSCEAASVSAGAAGDGFDRVAVELRFSARPDGGEPVNQLLRVTLARAATATSRRGLSCLDCPSCGGALAGSDDIKCRYCGAALTGGQQEWSLESIG